MTGSNNKFFGDNTNPKPTASHWTTANDANFMDNTDLAYFVGHGSPDGLIFGDGTMAGYSSNAWGDTIGPRQLAWVALGGCSILNNTGGHTNTHWDQVFKGLHSVVGWETDAYASPYWGGYFAYDLTHGYSIWDAWKDALRNTYHHGLGTRRIAVLTATGSDGNCVNDHLYGHGSWVAPGNHFTPGIYGQMTIYREYYTWSN